MINYSIIMPYYARSKELKVTLSMMYSFYNLRDDIEIIIVEDSKNYEDEALHNSLMECIDGWDIFHIKVILDPYISVNSCTKYNLGAHVSTGKYLILTNPEVTPLHNIIGHLDTEMVPNIYMIFDCASVSTEIDTTGKIDFKFLQWYEHMTIQRQYHFMSCISRARFIKIGGFDQSYKDGLAYEDDGFLLRIKKDHLTIVNCHDYVCAHQDHPRIYDKSSEELEALRLINRKIWEESITLYRNQEALRYSLNLIDAPDCVVSVITHVC